MRDNGQKSKIENVMSLQARRLRTDNLPAEYTWPNHVKMSSISDLSKTYGPNKAYYKDTSIPNRTFLVRFGGISAYFSPAMVPRPN